jgi:hypothetical protein
MTTCYNLTVQDILVALRLSGEDFQADWSKILTDPQSGETMCLWTSSYDVKGRGRGRETVGLPEDQLHQLVPLLLPSIVRSCHMCIECIQGSQHF